MVELNVNIDGTLEKTMSYHAKNDHTLCLLKNTRLYDWKCQVAISPLHINPLKPSAQTLSEFSHNAYNRSLSQGVQLT